MNTSTNIESKSFIKRIADTLLCLSKGKNAVTEIAEDCKLSVSTTHRLLNVLAGPGFTIYDPTSHLYYLGPLISQLVANQSITHQFLLRAATDEMKRLSGVVEETLILTVLQGIQSIALISIPSKHSLRVHEVDEDGKSVRTLTPLASGQRVLLSQLEDSKLNSVLESLKVLDDPLLDIEQTRKELKQVSEKGYAITRGIRTSDAIGISAPIKNYVQPLALTVLGPESRLERRISILTAELLASTNRISSNIQKLFK